MIKLNEANVSLNITKDELEDVFNKEEKMFDSRFKEIDIVSLQKPVEKNPEARMVFF